MHTLLLFAIRAGRWRVTEGTGHRGGTSGCCGRRRCLAAFGCRLSCFGLAIGSLRATTLDLWRAEVVLAGHGAPGKGGGEESWLAFDGCLAANDCPPTSS